MITGSLMTQDECINIITNVNRPIPVLLSQVGRSSMIVMDNSDIDSAVSCVADKSFFASGMLYIFYWINH